MFAVSGSHKMGYALLREQLLDSERHENLMDNPVNHFRLLCKYFTNQSPAWAGVDHPMFDTRAEADTRRTLREPWLRVRRERHAPLMVLHTHQIDVRYRNLEYI